jgi:protein O-GlcNAc transferase
MARLKQRLARTLGDAAGRVRFLSAPPNADFLQLLSLADVIFDPFPFGGGNTSHEVLAVGTPVVTWPGRYLRGRITLALYRKMGLTECIAQSPAVYVERSVRLATIADEREAIRRKIQTTSSLLYEDPAEIRALEGFFREAFGEGGPATHHP